MTQKAKVKVELDTGPAKAELRKFAKEGEQSAGRVNQAVQGGVGRAAALGAAAGIGFGLAQRAASRIGSLTPDVIGEGTAGFRAGLDDFFGGPEARAARAAREQTKDAYAEIIGRQKNPTVTPDIRNYYNTVREFREISERGGAAIDKQLGAEYIDDAVQSFVGAIDNGFDRIIDALQVTGK
jgi:hypothetical protein